MEFLLFILSFLLFVAILFENNDQSSWWSLCLMLEFCNQTKRRMTTNPKKEGRASDTPLPKSTPAKNQFQLYDCRI